MKELLYKYIQDKKNFQDEEYEVEKKFGEFLESIPGWEDKLGSIIISNSYDLSRFDPTETIGSQLIPSIRDINLAGGDRVSFKIQIPERVAFVPEYVETGWFPLEWLLNPDSQPINREYLKEKLKRREEDLKEITEEEEDLERKKKELTETISRIQNLLEEGT